MCKTFVTLKSTQFVHKIAGTITTKLSGFICASMWGNKFKCLDQQSCATRRASSKTCH